MSKLEKIFFITQNLAPFRIDWLDALSAYFSIDIYYYEEQDIKGKTNPAYMKRKPVIAKFQRICGKNVFQRAFRCFRKIMKAKKEDLVLLDGYGFSEQIVLIILFNLFHMRYAITVDGILINKGESKLKRFLKSRILRYSEFVFSSSEYTDKALMHYGVKKSRIIRHTFTPLYAKDVLPYRLTLDKESYKKQINCSNKFIILSVGKIIESKGFDINLKLAHRNPNFLFLIIGGEPLEEHKKYMVENDVQNVLFIKFCEKQILKQYYLAADIFFHPTRTDVWGLVINEAVAAGLPVITTSNCIAGVSLLENYKNGFIVPVDDENQMNERINYLYNNPHLMSEITKNNLNLALKNTIEESVKQDYRNLTKWSKENG